MIDSSVIKESITLSEIIGQDVQLRRSSGNPNRFLGKCPFHDDKTPSFCVDDQWGRYKCFACGKAGDCVQYLIETQGIDFKEALKQAKALAGIEDEYLTPAQKKAHEAKLKEAATEKGRFRKWKEELRRNLICYTSLEWEIYRKCRRQLMDIYTEELEDQSEEALYEAERKEKALERLESMPDNELMGYYRTRKAWEGISNPAWFLSGKRLEMVKAKGAK